MSLPSVIISLLLTIFIVCLVAYLVYVKFSEKYTREKYAFTALATASTLTILAIKSVTTAPPWTSLGGLMAMMLGKPLPELHVAPWSEKILILGFTAFVIWELHKAHMNWDGPVSERQHNLDQLSQTENLLSEGTYELRRLIARRPPEKVYQKPRYKFPQLQVPSVNLVWRDHARELAELRWPYYYFDVYEDWHQEAACWIGRHTQTGERIALQCAHDYPLRQSLEDLVRYVQKIVGLDSTVKFTVLTQSDTVRPTEVILGQEIHHYTEKSLLDNLVDFTDYVADIRRRVKKIALPDSDLTLIDTYVESYVTSRQGTTPGTPLESLLVEWLHEPGDRQLALLGEYGQGKSTGALMFAYKLLETYSRKQLARMPLLIDLRGKSPSSLQELELLGAWASNYRIDARALHKLLLAGRLCLIFEGFDEMAGVSGAEARFAHFQALWRFCYPGAKLLITGRPNFFLDDRELKASLNIDGPSGSGPYCQEFHLSPFTINQIKESLRWAPQQTAAEIASLAEDDEKFRDIVARPSLLYIVARLWETPEFAQVRDNMNSAVVMSVFVTHCFRRQTEKHRHSSKFMVLSENERRFFTDGLVCFMVKENLQNQLTNTNFDSALNLLYKTIPDDLGSPNVLADESPKPLKDRLSDSEDPIELIATDVRTYGLFVRDLSKPDALKFPHKSFFEYLFAEYIVERITQQETSITNAIQVATKVSLESVVEMPESLKFAGELIFAQRKGAESGLEFIDELLDMVVFSGRLHFSKFIRKMVLRLQVTRMKTPFLAPSIGMLPLVLFMGLYMYLREPILSVLKPSLPNSHEQRGLFLCVLFALVAFGIFAYIWALLFFTLMRSSILRKRIVLWAYILKNLDFNVEDLTQVYGRLIARGLPKLVERQLGSDIDPDSFFRRGPRG